MIQVRLDRRVLGALRPIDVNTNLPITDPVRIQAEGLRFVRNRSGDFVISRAEGFAQLDALTNDFAPDFEHPSQPELNSISVDADIVVLNSIAQGNLPPEQNAPYLPRRVTLQLPRDPDPGHAEPDHPDFQNSLFQPIEVRLFPALNAPVPIGATLVRAIVTNNAPAGEEEGKLAGALVRIRRPNGNGGEVIARGMTQWRKGDIAESMIPVNDVPLTTWMDDDMMTGADGPDDEENPVLMPAVQVVIDAIWDANVDLAAGQLPDPEQLETHFDQSAPPNIRQSGTINISLVFGKHVAVRIPINTTP